MATTEDETNESDLPPTEWPIDLSPVLDAVRSERSPVVGDRVGWNLLTGIIVELNERNACIDWRDGELADWWPVTWLQRADGEWSFVMPPAGLK